MSPEGGGDKKSVPRETPHYVERASLILCLGKKGFSFIFPHRVLVVYGADLAQRQIDVHVDGSRGCGKGIVCK